MPRTPLQSIRWSPPGGKRPFSATGGNADGPALPNGGGKGIVIPETLEKRDRLRGDENAGTATAPQMPALIASAVLMAKAPSPQSGEGKKRSRCPLPPTSSDWPHLIG